MAYSSLTDGLNPNVFANLITEGVFATNALLSSGAIVRSNELNLRAGQPGSVGTLPVLNVQAYSDPDIATDDATQATLSAAQIKPQIFQKDYLSRTYGVSELMETVNGVDMIQQIVDNKVVPDVNRIINSFAMSKLNGVIAHNIATDGGDMVVNVNLDTVAATTSLTGPSVSTFTDAMTTMGDNRGKISLVIMHSVVYGFLMKNDGANTLRASATTPFPSYMGIPVYLDDTVPVVNGTNKKLFTCYLLGEGALAYGEADLGVRAVEAWKNPTAGNGWGNETLTVRKQVILHPVGHSSAAGTVTNGLSPLRTAYEVAGAWTRVLNRKNCPIIALKVNANV
ncbi:major capsid protein [Sphingomonas sp. AR_OL41]|uniref:major capsid protein n=1 Tax=Sphingomonas sp. AR_OL41 TaxID=3042729 RepID=UPI0024810843|nr:major capsid protein [Sphingomonas sp. AR_OL41]MDH7971045.1 major capsid protein [Sphingomonas sp. AR_OL41]